MARQPGSFDVDDRLRRLSDVGDQLEAFNEIVDFEVFRAELEVVPNCSDGTKGGRLLFDAVPMFKILIIQAQNNLSDDRAELLERPGTFAVDQSIGTLGVEPDHPVADDLQANARQARGIASPRTAVNLSQSKQTTNLRAVPAPFRQSPQPRATKVIAKSIRWSHPDPPFSVRSIESEISPLGNLQNESRAGSVGMRVATCPIARSA